MDETITDAAKLKYRCPCGSEFQVSVNRGGECPNCHRRVSPNAIEELISSTVSFLEHSTLLSDQSSTEGEPDPWIGRQLGHFEIIDRLGGGGMGAVYRALDRSLQRYVAVKLIRTSADQLPEDRKVKSLLQEAVAQARVHHPNVVTIYYVSHEQQTPFLAMELMTGSLASSTRRGPIPFASVMDTAIQVTEALRASYNLDVVHGDIKPSNLLVDRLGTVKLSDFGLARRIDAAEDDDVGLRGTPNYLSPAIMAGGAPSFRSDMYALGITLYELTFGAPPQNLTGNSVAAWIAERKKLALRPPEGKTDHIPRNWLPILERLLELDSQTGFQDYDELLHCLVNVRPSSELPAGRLPRLVAWSVDQVVIASVVVGLATMAISQDPSRLELWWMIFLLPAVAYSAVVSRLGTSLGYFAMQLRLLDASGQLPVRKVLVLREGMRTIVFWLFLGCVVALDSRRESVVYLLAGVFWTIFFIDIAAILLPGAACLHDRFFKTRVVLRRAGR
ncbi:MAG: protein kinase [Pirellulaceae bacterium]|nr:protein kinase [Pirellulaceae bacterium]